MLDNKFCRNFTKGTSDSDQANKLFSKNHITIVYLDWCWWAEELYKLDLI